MKILLTNSTCKVGGVSTFMLGLRSQLVALGHECELFFFSRGTMERHLPPTCPVHFGTLADCMRLVARERIEVVHGNNIDWTTGISAVRALGARLVLTAHKVREHDRTYGWTSATCDAFTTVSRGNARELQPFTDLPIHTVVNGIDTAMFSPSPDLGRRAEAATPVVAWIGRGGSPIKRLEAFAAIAPALRDAGLRVWVIDQHDRSTFVERAPDAAAALATVAERWDALEFDEMPALYRAIAATGGCVVSTSTAEGLPLAALEAQACGCVMIGPDVRGVNEAVLPDDGGVLYPSWLDAPELARIVIDAVRDRATMRARQLAAATHVREHFGLDRMAQEYLRVYRAAPLAAETRARVRARLRFSPMVNWQTYLEYRWGVGQAQYEALREFARTGEWRLAAGAGRASFSTSPTIFVKPRRLANLLKVQLLQASSRT